jgi:hypothetical protein
MAVGFDEAMPPKVTPPNYLQMVETSARCIDLGKA